MKQIAVIFQAATKSFCPGGKGRRNHRHQGTWTSLPGLFLCQESCGKRGWGWGRGLVTRRRNTSDPSHFPAVFTQQSLGEWWSIIKYPQSSASPECGWKTPRTTLVLFAKVAVRSGLCLGQCLPSFSNEHAASIQTGLSVRAVLGTDHKVPPESVQTTCCDPRGQGAGRPVVCLTSLWVSTTYAAGTNP